MTTEIVNDLETVSLNEYLSADKFRIIPPEAFTLGGGISELPVILNLHADFNKTLAFDNKKLQKIYAYVIMQDKLKELNDGPYYSLRRGGKLKCLELNDCGE